MDQRIGDAIDLEQVESIETQNSVEPRLQSLPRSIVGIILEVLWYFYKVLSYVLCSPVVWIFLHAICAVISEIFVYLVLATCSFLITIITQIDEHYTKHSSNKPDIRMAGDVSKNIYDINEAGLESIEQRNQR